MALALSRAGADLILVQRNDTNTTTRDQIRKDGGWEGKGGKADIAVCDLSDKADVAKLIPHVTSKDGMGRVLDVVVNCGGSLSLICCSSAGVYPTWRTGCW